MKTKNNKTYCTRNEFEARYNKMSYKDDTLKDDYYEGKEALIWRNSDGCLLGVWFKWSHEYKEF